MANIKVLIVEDSPLVADLLKQALESDKQVQVVGVASNGQDAIELVPKLKPDLITMDVWMPVLDGFATVEWVMANKPTPILVITSSKLKQDVQISLRMLAAGALDVIEKPALTDEAKWTSYRRELTFKVKLLSSVRVITHVRGRHIVNAATPEATPPTVTNNSASLVTPKPEKGLPPAPPLIKPNEIVPSKTIPGKPVLKPIENVAKVVPAPETVKVKPDTPQMISQVGWPLFPSASHYQVIAIASSTGGPTALLKVLQKLPPNFPAGIVIVQHISEGFTQGLVDWLQREIKLKMKVAKDGDSPQPGEVLIAPDRRDVIMQTDFKIQTRRDSGNILCPSADVMMNAIADTYGRQSIGVVLTGMGSDGAKGLKKIYDLGGYTIAQNEATSLIYGMPRAAAELGGARDILPLEDIAGRLIELLQQPLQPDDLIRPIERTKAVNS